MRCINVIFRNDLRLTDKTYAYILSTYTLVSVGLWNLKFETLKKLSRLGPKNQRIERKLQKDIIAEETK